jgi:hypothetical protein
MPKLPQGVIRRGTVYWYRKQVPEAVGKQFDKPKQFEILANLGRDRDGLQKAHAEAQLYAAGILEKARTETSAAGLDQWEKGWHEWVRSRHGRMDKVMTREEYAAELHEYGDRPLPSPMKAARFLGEIIEGHRQFQPRVC